MADPFSIAAGVVGILAPALQGIQKLVVEIRNIKDAPETLQILKKDLELVDLALRSVKEIDESQWEFLGEAIANHAKVTIESCSNACTVLGDKLARWTRRSPSGKLSWMDRGNIALLKQHQIQSISEQLRNCQTTITSMVSTATLCSSIRNTQMTQAIKGTLSKRHEEISTSITTTEQQVNEAQTRLRGLELTASSAPFQADPDQEQEPSETLQQIREETKALDASHQLLMDLLVKTDNIMAENQKKLRERRNEVTVTFGPNYGGFQMGTNEGTIGNIQFGSNMTRQ
ncbi:hypothetical protein QQX98_012211 [Neonectria punicea]|uniref:Azaphilone pigments biosynthesis cluster protein L N-terminal domain-containing protein n=1 Tax=Neonectria punicea TaxID=979145 RepID=A0ABR1GJT1_9HYPO